MAVLTPLPLPRQRMRQRSCGRTNTRPFLSLLRSSTLPSLGPQRLRSARLLKASSGSPSRSPSETRPSLWTSKSHRLLIPASYTLLRGSFAESGWMRSWCVVVFIHLYSSHIPLRYHLPSLLCFPLTAECLLGVCQDRHEPIAQLRLCRSDLRPIQSPRRRNSSTPPHGHPRRSPRLCSSCSSSGSSVHYASAVKLFEHGHNLWPQEKIFGRRKKTLIFD